MVMVGTIGTAIAGACITTLGCIPDGVIMIPGIPVIMAMDMVAGTIHGGVITVMAAIMEDIMVIMILITVTVVITGTETLAGMHSPVTNITSQTTNATLFPM